MTARGWSGDRCAGCRTGSHAERPASAARRRAASRRQQLVAGKKTAATVYCRSWCVDGERHLAFTSAGFLSELPAHDLGPEAEPRTCNGIRMLPLRDEAALDLIVSAPVAVGPGAGRTTIRKPSESVAAGWSRLSWIGPLPSNPSSPSP